ncbi:MAG: hypothetical protein QNI93_11030 [Kiloniellales bacterium]|nr:hypothetical protein [Kiloniellales bacterium]
MLEALEKVAGTGLLYEGQALHKFAVDLRPVVRKAGLQPTHQFDASFQVGPLELLHELGAFLIAQKAGILDTALLLVVAGEEEARLIFLGAVQKRASRMQLAQLGPDLIFDVAARVELETTALPIRHRHDLRQLSKAEGSRPGYRSYRVLLFRRSRAWGLSHRWRSPVPVRDDSGVAKRRA